MKVITHFIAIALVLTLAGCGSAQYKQSTIEVDEPYCVVYVFRDEFTLVWSMNIKVGGTTYAKLSDNFYASFPLKTGERIVEARWNFLAGGIDLDVPIECRENEEIYVAFWGYVEGNTRHIKGARITRAAAEQRFATHKEINQ